MKQIVSGILLAVFLSLDPHHSSAASNTPQKPQFLVAVGIVVETVAVGVVAYIFWDKITDGLADWFLVTGGLWNKVFSKPPPDEPDPVQVQRDSLTSVPLLQISCDPHCVAARAIETNGWWDANGSCLFTNVIQTTVQSREDLQSPWTNFFTMTLWDSSAGSLALIRNGQWSPVYTSYVFRAQGARHTVPRGLLDDPAAPRKFYRLAAIPK